MDARSTTRLVIRKRGANARDLQATRVQPSDDICDFGVASSLGNAFSLVIDHADVDAEQRYDASALPMAMSAPGRSLPVTTSFF